MEDVDKEREINDLLCSKGLNCVCQLCDCGRVHKHSGCKIPHPSVAVTFCEGGTKKVQSDYRARFPAYESQPAKPIYHEQEIKGPNPGEAMDLNTTKQTSYKKFDNAEVRKPCKLKGEIDKFMSGEFNDKTNYKDSFVGYNVKPIKPARPSTVFKYDGVPFVSQTEYMNGFQKKQKVRRDKIPEKPAHTYDLLYPHSDENSPKISLMNSIHDGRIGEKVKPCDMAKPNIDFGLHGEFDHTTTNGVHFKDFDSTPVRTKPKRRSDQKAEVSKFDAISQNQADFQYNGSEAALARGKKVTEHPSLIQLSMDMTHDFQTVSNLSYHNWKADDFKRPMGANKPTSTYTPSKDKFDHDSHTHKDYVNYGVTPRTMMCHPPEFRKSSAKVSDESIYRESFQNHTTPRRKFYGEYHSPNLQLPPSEKKFDASSTMRLDYQPMKADKRKPFKPTYTPQINDVKLSTATEYNETYLAKQNQPCTFSHYLSKQKMSKIPQAGQLTVP